MRPTPHPATDTPPGVPRATPPASIPAAELAEFGVGLVDRRLHFFLRLMHPIRHATGMGRGVRRERGGGGAVSAFDHLNMNTKKRPSQHFFPRSAYHLEVMFMQHQQHERNT